MAENKGGRSTGRAADGADVARFPDQTKDRYLTIRCTECGSVVDRVEYSVNEGPNPHVAQLVSLLGCDEKTAGKILSEQNPELLRSQEERARDLAEHIVARDVPDRAANTYECRNGHDADLEVTE